MVTSNLAYFALLQISLVALAAPLAAQNAAEPVPAPFDGSLMRPASRSYSLILQGTDAGTVDVSTTIANGTITLQLDVDVFTPAGSVSQHGEYVFTDDLNMVSTFFTGDFGMFQTETNVTFANRRATGQGQSPGPGGFTTTIIDTTLAEGVIDSGMVPALLPTLEWSNSTAYTFDAFDSNTGTVRTVTLRVIGSEEVTVPAGTFDTWVVESSGGPQAMTFRLAKDSGAIVKMVPPGQAMEMVLKATP